eukprot:TRINITY_DN606_c0_g1_i2.p1 TRINITY_DN606_c0_g1~~TRINITY_DN606_c0_g1_i2.p1  ORF type:complete len:1060 (-),score=203.79 TRINITY_DN606_c0_g1_i2:1386-4565(-)
MSGKRRDWCARVLVTGDVPCVVRAAANSLVCLPYADAAEFVSWVGSVRLPRLQPPGSPPGAPCGVDVAASVLACVRKDLTTTVAAAPDVAVVAVSLLDRQGAVDGLAVQLDLLRRAVGPRCRVVLCAVDVEAALAYQDGDREAAHARLRAYGLNASALDDGGPVGFSELRTTLDRCGPDSICSIVRIVALSADCHALLADVVAEAVSLPTTCRGQAWADQPLFSFIAGGIAFPETLAPLARDCAKKLHRALKPVAAREALEELIHAAFTLGLPQDLLLTCLLHFVIDANLVGDTDVFTILISHFPAHTGTWQHFIAPSLRFMLAVTDQMTHCLHFAEERRARIVVAPETDGSFLLLREMPKLFCCVAVTKLDLSHNYLSTVPEELAAAVNLTSANFSWNCLRVLPDTFGRLIYLTDLNIEHNSFETLPLCLTDMPQTNVWCGFNQLGQIPLFMLHHLQSGKLSYSPNPCSDRCGGDEGGDPHVAHEDLSLLRAMVDLCSTSTAPISWDPMKLVLVGPENVGKTSILARLLGRSHDGISTDGVAAAVLLTLRDLHFSVWDFGGQAVFHPTHQFFLTSRALYLVVFDLEKPDFHRIDYWLRQIQKTARQPPGPPVILVGTRADKVTPDAACDLCASVLQRYRFVGKVVACVPVCTLEGGDLSELVELIYKTALTRQQILRDKVPAFYIGIATALKKYQCAKKNTVSWVEFKELCKQHGVTEDAQAKQVALFLHEVGKILYFDSKYSSLSNLVVVNPQFLADIMRTIITFHFNVKNGILLPETLALLWAQYEPQTREMITDLLVTFSVIHPITLPDAAHAFLVPCTLPVSEPDGFHTLWPPLAPKRVQYERCYTFHCLPVGIFGRFLVRVLHLQHLVNSLYWRDNLLVIQQPGGGPLQGGFAQFCTVSDSNPMFRIIVRASSDVKPTLLSELLDCLDTTLSCFYAPHTAEVDRTVVCCSCPPRTAPEDPPPHVFNAERLASEFTRGCGFVWCPVENANVSISRIAPELAQFDTTVAIDPTQITDAVQVATGGFGAIFKGAYRLLYRRLSKKVQLGVFSHLEI